MTIIPIRTVPGLNAREHFRARARRVKAERQTTAWLLAPLAKPDVPCVVLLTRIGPSNGLDDDNLAGALKAVRDEIARWLGVDDRRSEIVKYRYAQRRGKAWGVSVEFQTMEGRT